jgi:chemotaxis protein methyltransferase CheR
MRDERAAELETGELAALLEAIHERYGCDLRGYAPRSLERRLALALARTGTRRLSELRAQVLRDADAFAGLLHDLTVHVSGLFRDPAFYRGFCARVLPELRGRSSIRIWHAGCASGEEAYASAILLSEAGLYERAQIYATDLSPLALARARHGVYSLAQFRSFERNYRAAGGRRALAGHFHVAHGGVAVRAALRRNILFFQHERASDHGFGVLDVVFCRNVLIYFGPELRARVLRQLTRSLCPGGFLCLGESERLSIGQGAAPFSALAGAERIYRHTGAAR